MKTLRITFIIILIFISGCKVQQITSTNDNDNISPFYGAFTQNTIDWYVNKELSIESHPSGKKITYLGRPFRAKNKEFIRTTSSDFKPSPVVNYVFNESNKKIMEIHYEWDIINHLPKDEKYKVRLETKSKADEFVSFFEKLSTIISSQLGEESREGSLNMDEGLSYEYIEVTDSWNTDDFICELYMIFSNQYEKKGYMEIKPTHRIRCKMTWK